MKILTVIGARPQFIKASPVSEILKNEEIQEIIVNTGQHYDFNMSDIFFRELNIPVAKYNLNVGSNTHGRQTGSMLIKLDEVIEQEKPDTVLVYGDTNSTISGALAASKYHIPIVHVEAGLRSFNRKMPEEINRVLTDHISSILFCPSNVSKTNLEKEGICNGAYVVGDVMHDLFSKFNDRFINNSEYGEYALLTLHRAENTFRIVLEKRINQIKNLGIKVVFPIHPRTKKYMKQFDISLPKNVECIDPVGWPQLMGLVKGSQFVITDSGGLQKEALWQRKYCFSLRDQTEWIETIYQKVNFCIGDDETIDLGCMKNGNFNNPYGDGNASKEIVRIIKDYY